MSQKKKYNKDWTEINYFKLFDNKKIKSQKLRSVAETYLGGK